MVRELGPASRKFNSENLTSSRREATSTSTVSIGLCKIVVQFRQEKLGITLGIRVTIARESGECPSCHFPTSTTRTRPIR
jgi:hypothetical protein